MTTDTTHMFTLTEAASAYALAAERICGDDDEFFDLNPATFPILVSHLFQSLEISIKAAGIESGLFTSQEARGRRKGHGICELAQLAMDRLGGETDDLLTAMTFADRHGRSGAFIGLMISGAEMERTRESYASRRLGYGEVPVEGFGYITPIKEWVEAVKRTATNLPTTIDCLRQWKASPSKSKPFAIRYR